MEINVILRSQKTTTTINLIKSNLTCLNYPCEIIGERSQLQFDNHAEAISCMGEAQDDEHRIESMLN